MRRTRDQPVARLDVDSSREPSYPAVRNAECVKPKFPGLLVSRERQFTAHKDTSHSVVSDSVQATVSEASGRETRSPTPQYLCVDRGRQLSVKATAVEP